MSPAAALPARIWTALYAERLALIGERPRRRRLVSPAIAAAAVSLVLWFAGLVDRLQRGGAATSFELSLALLLVRAPLSLASLVHRSSSPGP